MGTPAAPLHEPAFEYAAVEFHRDKAAKAASEERAVFAFVDKGYLFKFEAKGGTKVGKQPDVAVEAIWKFRQSK